MEKGGGREVPTLAKELLAFDCCWEGESQVSPTDLEYPPHLMWAPNTGVVSLHKLDLTGEGREGAGHEEHEVEWVGREVEE